MHAQVIEDSLGMCITYCAQPNFQNLFILYCDANYIANMIDNVILLSIGGPSTLI